MRSSMWPFIHQRRSLPRNPCGSASASCAARHPARPLLLSLVPEVREWLSLSLVRAPVIRVSVVPTEARRGWRLATTLLSTCRFCAIIRLLVLLFLRMEWSDVIEPTEPRRGLASGATLRMSRSVGIYSLCKRS